MKSIIIAGIARAGKTTVCEELCKRGYSHFTCDSLIYSLEHVFPELGINQEETTEGVQKTSKNFAPLLLTLAKCIEEEYLPYPVVFDVYQFMPEDYMKYMKTKDVSAYFLGYPDISLEEEFKILRENKAKREYTQEYSDKYLKKLIKQRINESKFIKEECEKYRLPFINTSYNREEKISKLVNRILEDVKGSSTM